MKRAAVVLRAGPGIRLDLHDGKVFVVTIDDPDIPARLLNAEASRLEAAERMMGPGCFAGRPDGQAVNQSVREARSITGPCS